MEVRFADGKTETVFVRIVPVKAYGELMGALQDELRTVEIYCERPKGWAEGLTVEAHEELVRAGERLNEGFFGRWRERQSARQKYLPKQNVEEIGAMIEVLQKTRPELLEQIMSKAVAGLPITSPKSASGPS